MKTTIFVLLSLIIFAVACTRNTTSAATPQDAIVIEYATYNGHPVELVYDQNDGGLVLRIRYNKGDNTIHRDDAAVNFLKEEALRLTSSTRTMPLGKSGYSFKFLGGHPIWAPHMIIDHGYNYNCLKYAEKGSITGKMVVARGTKQIEGYNGYALWKPDIPKKQ